MNNINNKKQMTCCFTGHRKLPPEHYDKIKALTRSEVVKLIDVGVRYFGTGGALGFDTLAAQIILELKKTYPDIKLILVLPCYNQTARWNIQDIEIYEYIKSKCDKYVYTSKDYNSHCMFKRNKHLVDNSDYCICYLSKQYGGTAQTVEYAYSQGIKVINVCDLSM